MKSAVKCEVKTAVKSQLKSDLFIYFTDRHTLHDLTAIEEVYKKLDFKIYSSCLRDLGFEIRAGIFFFFFYRIDLGIEKLIKNSRGRYNLTNK